MAAQFVRFFSLLFVGLTLAPGLAHVLQMPHKMDLTGNDYLRVQQLYAGWALLGIVAMGALISTLLLTILVRARLRQFALACIAFGSVLATQVIFWMLTFPVNQQTKNWTTLPVNWMTLRERWEYSHATAAVFDVIAFVAVVLAVLAAVGHREDEPMRWAAPGPWTGLRWTGQWVGLWRGVADSNVVCCAWWRDVLVGAREQLLELAHRQLAEDLRNGVPPSMR